jgi:hypothetical protein
MTNKQKAIFYKKRRDSIPKNSIVMQPERERLNFLVNMYKNKKDY